jgi:arginyl-tRNA synthetase
MKTDPILPQASLRAEPGWESRWDFAKTAARLAWVEAIRTVYAAALSVLGVSAPERMDKPASSGGDGDADGADEGEADRDEKE